MEPRTYIPWSSLSPPKFSHNSPVWLLTRIPFVWKIPTSTDPQPENILPRNTGLSDFMEASYPCSRGLVYLLKLNSLWSIKMKIKSFKPQPGTESSTNTAVSGSSKYVFLVVTLCFLHPSGVCISQSTEFFPTKFIQLKSFSTINSVSQG